MDLLSVKRHVKLPVEHQIFENLSDTHRIFILPAPMLQQRVNSTQ